jgi:hypothetical protein
MNGRRVRRALRTLAALAIVAGGVVLADVSPAAAHGVGGLEPTNYETRVDGITPKLEGIEARAVDLSDRIELRNDGHQVVTVLGYEREPYLRIGPAGTWENERSPAVFLNRTRIPERAAPHRYDADAPPRWRKVSDDRVASWHDHRAHWMANDDPPAVRRDPGHAHFVIRNWRIPLVVGGQRAAITGDALWVPGPSPWPWILGAVGLALLVGLLCRTKAWVAVMEISVLVLIVSESVHVVGAWQATTAAVGSRALASIYSLGGIVVCVLAFVWLRRRDPWAATPAVLVAGLFVFVAGGLADLTALTRSQLPTSLPSDLGRLTVTIALGLGAGLVAGAAGRLRAPPTPAEPEPPAPVPTLVR